MELVVNGKPQLVILLVSTHLKLWHDHYDDLSPRYSATEYLIWVKLGPEVQSLLWQVSTSAQIDTSFQRVEPMCISHISLFTRAPDPQHRLTAM